MNRQAFQCEESTSLRRSNLARYTRPRRCDNEGGCGRSTDDRGVSRVRFVRHTALLSRVRRSPEALEASPFNHALERIVVARVRARAYAEARVPLKVISAKMSFVYAERAMCR